MKNVKVFSGILACLTFALMALGLVLAACSSPDGGTPSTYTVTFHANGGTGTAPPAQTVSPGSSITLPGGSGLSKTGLLFGGWNTNTSGTGTNYDVGASYTPAGTFITLYARWIDGTISNVAVTVTAPVAGEVPSATASGTGFSGTVSWSPNDNPFKSNTVYTASISLTVQQGFSFASTLTAVRVNGANASITAYTENTLALSYAFAATGKYNPTVTWPIGLTATSSQTLSDISLVGKGTSVQAGTFSWTTPSNPVGRAGTRSHSMTFTPNDTANYNTLTNDVAITVQYIPVAIEMVNIAGGTFTMGTASGGNSDERPQRQVMLSAFKMGKYEVTQEQWQAVMGTNPSNFASNPATGEIQNKRPVERVSWDDALVFCNTLSMLEGLTPAYRINNSTDPDDWGSVPTSSNSTWNAVTIVSGSNGYRLPTEAQWEYAAKGGNGSPGNYTYAGSNTVGDVAWYTSNSGSRTHEVGTKTPNGLGLYDMSGNVWEWCWDRYGTYPSVALETDPLGASSGAYRVGRGGSWGSSAGDLRSAARDGYNPINRYYNLGFRLVRP